MAMHRFAPPAGSAKLGLMQQLPIFLNLAGRLVLVIGEGAAADAKARLVARAGGQVVRQWQQGVMLAFVALEDEAAASKAAEDLRAKGLLVNVVDRPQYCDFTTPAIVDRAPVTIAVGTAGASAGLAKAVRQRIEALLPSRLGALAEALLSARPSLKQRWPDAAARRRALDGALAAGGALDPLREDAADRVTAWLAHSGDVPTGRLEIVRLSSDDPDDLSLRHARLMGEADHIFHTARLPAAILNRARADAERHICAALPADLPAILPHGLCLWLDEAPDPTASGLR